MKLAEMLRQLPLDQIALVAGVGYQTGIVARDADAGWPMGVVRRADGDLIVVDYQAHRLWRIDREGILHRFAGDGIPGDVGDGGPAAEARFRHPHDLFQDRHGHLYLSDLGNRSVRRIDAQTGEITRVAGNGQVGRGGDGGLAVDAELDCTCGVAVDAEGNVFLADEWACTIRRIDAQTGIIETWAGLTARHYPSEQGASRPSAGPGLSLLGYHGDGGPARTAAFHHPEHLAFDSDGHLFVCDNSNDRIRRIDASTGVISTVLGTGQRASNGDGGPADQASTLMPDALCLDAHDNLYVGEKYGFRVRKVAAQTRIVTTLVGTGVPGFGEEGLPGSETTCNSCEAGIWADSDGTVLWSDCSGRLRRYDGQSRIVTTVLGGTGVHDGEPAEQGFLCGPGGLAMGPGDQLYVADVWNQRIRGIDLQSGLIRTVAGTGARAYGGDNGLATAAHLGNPHDVSVDRQGRLCIADTRHGHVRYVDSDGIIRSLVGAAFQWDKGDGGPANSACLVHVLSVAHDAQDHLYLGDAGAGRIRRVDARTGVIETIAGCGRVGYQGDGGPADRAQIGHPAALAFDRAGQLYFADSKYHVLRKIDRSGRIETIAGTGQPGFSPDGTSARTAQIHTPFGLAVAADGRVYFADSYNHRVRRITVSGQLETVAGGANAGDAGLSGPAVAAALNEPHGLCFYGDQILLISDRNNNRIKAVCVDVDS